MELIRGGAWLPTFAGKLQAHTLNYEAILHHVSDSTAQMGHCLHPDFLLNIQVLLSLRAVCCFSVPHFLFLSVMDSLSLSFCICLLNKSLFSISLGIRGSSEFKI